MIEEEKQKGFSGMEPTEAKRSAAVRGGAFFPLLALILTFVTLWGIGMSLSPSVTLSRAMKKTGKELAKREEGVLEILSVLKEGSISLEGKNVQGEYTAHLPQKAALAMKGEAWDLSLTALDDTLSFESATLLEKGLSGPRRGSAAAFSQSAFQVARGEEGAELIALFLAFSDPDLWEDEAIGDVAEAVWKKADPRRETQKASLFRDEEEISAGRQKYIFDSACLLRALDALAQKGQEEEVKASLLAKNTLFRTLLGKEVNEEEKTRFLEFLSGKGEAFLRLKEEAAKENSQVALEFFIRRGRVIDIKISFHFGSYEGTGEMFFGKDLKKEESTRISFLVREGEETAFSLTATLALLEDSKNAYVRELDYSITDSKMTLLSSSDPVSGKVRYSWGKGKSDLGLRFITPDGQVGFGGVLKENKREKRSVEISRYEIDRKNQLEDGVLILTLSPEEKEVTLPQAQGALFPEGEEKTALEQSFSEKFREIFGGGDAQ